MTQNRTPQQMTLDIIRIAEILSQNQLHTDSCYKQEDESHRAVKERQDESSTEQANPS